MTKLCFDARFIKPEHPDGISRFSLNLIAELATMCELTVLISSPEVAAKMPAGVKMIQLPNPTSALEVLTALKLNRAGVKVVFSPMQTTGSLGKKFKLILTLHDLIYYRHRTPPKEFSWAIRVLWRLYHLTFWPQRMVLNGADHVVTVSETTKRQMLQKRLTERPISVIYNSGSGAIESRASSNHESQQLSYMGSFIGYKNVETLIRGMGLLPDLTLVCLSRISDQRRNELQNLADQVGAKVEFRNGVSDEEYNFELERSLALVSASRDEGFGIPVVEALERGIPAVISDIEIFEEIGGEAALRFSQDSAQEFASQVRKLQDQQVWMKRSALAIEQARNFSWKKSAEQLLVIARQLGA